MLWIGVTEKHGDLTKKDGEKAERDSREVGATKLHFFPIFSSSPKLGTKKERDKMVVVG